MAIYEIPLTPEPQNFQVALGNVIYRMLLRWCDPAQVWVLDINLIDGTAVIEGVPLVAGVDLLEPYAYLGLGGKLTASTKNKPETPPTFTNLGIDSHVYFETL